MPAIYQGFAAGLVLVQTPLFQFSQDVFVRGAKLKNIRNPLVLTGQGHLWQAQNEASKIAGIAGI